MKTSDQNLMKYLWPGNFFLNGVNSNSRGVSIFIKNTFEYKIIDSIADKSGNMLSLDMSIGDNKVFLLNIFGPNNDVPSFFENIKSTLLAKKFDYLLWCVDFNIAINPSLDTYNYSHINNPRSKKL